jgi:hypothetical protein
VPSFVLWFILVSSLLYASGVVGFIVWLRSMARKGKAAVGCHAVGCWPVFSVMPVVLLAGALAAGALAATVRQAYLRAAVGAVGGLFALWVLLIVIATVRQLLRAKRDTRIERRILDQAEMLELIRAGAISSFTKDGDEVAIRYRVHDLSARPRRADPAGYAAYVAAANERVGSDEVSAYRNRHGLDPASGCHRWIIVDEARVVLEDLRTASLTYGRRYRDEVAASGPPSGLILVDHGWVRHLYVQPELVETMIPIVLAAHYVRAHRKPLQIYYDPPVETS